VIRVQNPEAHHFGSILDFLNANGVVALGKAQALIGLLDAVAYGADRSHMLTRLLRAFGECEDGLEKLDA
jgi:hypothetical protein